MQSPIAQMLMGQLKARNPQAYQTVEKAMQNQSNPIDLFKQITSNRSPEQMSTFYKQIEQMGFPNDVINQLKDINTK